MEWRLDFVEIGVRRMACWQLLDKRDARIKMLVSTFLLALLLEFNVTGHEGLERGRVPVERK